MSAVESNPISGEHGYALYLWPCAVRLCEYLHCIQDQLVDKVVLELGCGCALPGITAAILGAKQVILTDHEANRDALKLAQSNVELNQAAIKSSTISVASLPWGSLNAALTKLSKIDILLASDCFYDPAVFDDLLFTISNFLNANSSCYLIFSYQIRNASWTILDYLDKWNLICEPISTDFSANDIIYETVLDPQIKYCSDILLGKIRSKR